MKIGLYLGSFKPMHQGHLQVITQAADANDVLLFFPGYGAKGVKKGKRTFVVNGVKKKIDFYRPMQDQIMMTDDIAQYQFSLIANAIEREKLKDPQSVYGKIKIILPGETVGDFTSATAPVRSVYQIVSAIGNHYSDSGGDMRSVYIPYLDFNIDEPVVRIYSDVSDTKRVSKSMLGRVGITPDALDAIYMKYFIPVGIVRGVADKVDWEYEPAEFETMDIRATEIRQRIKNLDNLSDEELETEITWIAGVLPSILDHQVKTDFISKIRELDRERRVAGGIRRDLLGKITESVGRDDLILGTEEYGKYINELIDGLRHFKNSFKTRSKKGARHRKEAARLQSAIDSLKYMARKNDRQLLKNSMINERLVRSVTPCEEDIFKKQEEVFSQDNIREFFYKYKR